MRLQIKTREISKDPSMSAEANSKDFLFNAKFKFKFYLLSNDFACWISDEGFWKLVHCFERILCP